MIPKDKFLDQLKQVVLDVFERFCLKYNIFNKTVFCFLGEKQGKLINDECSSWYKKSGNFFLSVWDGRKEILHCCELAHEVNQAHLYQEYEVNAIECYGG